MRLPRYVPLVCALLGAALPFGLLVCVVFTYRLAIPFLDQWQMIPVMDRLFHGALRGHDVWEQVNEHRMLFPKLLMVALARLSHWNLAWELVLNFILGTGLYALLTVPMLRGLKAAQSPAGPWLAVLNAWLIFSLKPRDNWIWSWEIAFLLAPLALCGALFVLCAARLDFTRLAAAMLLGVVASLSLGVGMLLWPLGFALLCLRSDLPRAQLRRMLAAWAGFCVLMLAIYFYHYQRPPHPAGPWFFLAHPLDYARFVFGLIGMPLLTRHAAWVGAAGVALHALALRRMIRERLLPRLALLPLMAIAAWVVCEALLIAQGRLSYGLDQVLASRYITLMLPFWVVTGYFLALLLSTKTRSFSSLRTPVLISLSLIALLAVRGSLKTIHEYRELHDWLAPAQELIRTATPEQLARPVNAPLLLRIYPVPFYVIEYSTLLKSDQLALFRPGA